MRKKTVDMIPVLSDDIKAVLSSFSKSHPLPASLVKRSKIILLASQGMPNQTIALQVGLHYNHVANWLNRFLATLPSLREIEAGAPEKLEEEIRLLLSDGKRSGALPVFTQEQIMAIIALACQNPCDLGYEVSQWSLPLFDCRNKKQGIVDRISDKSVSRFFNEVDLQPHRIRYWLHSPEKEETPKSFAQKVNEICGIYQNAQETSQKGYHIISTDEMTGIQALEHKYPDKSPLPVQCAKMEFEYIRHGTTSLIGGGMSHPSVWRLHI